MPFFKTEMELAAELVKFLEEKNWEVYQEVAIDGRILDILAINKNTYWAIECKNNLNIDVIEQAYYWKDFVDYSSICIPYPNKKAWRRFRFAKKLLSNVGLGLVAISKKKKCNESVYAKQNSPIKKGQIQIFEEQKTYKKAGGKSGYYTAFKKTVERILDYVKEHPGASVEEVMTEIEHHYKTRSSAITSLKKILLENGIQGIYYVFDENSKMKLFKTIGD